MTDFRPLSAPRRRPDGRAFRWALPLALAVHAAVLAWVAIPGPRESTGRRSLFLVPMPEVTLDRRHEPAAPGAPEHASEEASPTARLMVAVPVETPGAPEGGTIAPTGLLDLSGPIQPLEVGPRGLVRRRALPEDDGRRLAVARAESIVHARLAAMGVASRPTSGPITLANGGVTVAIPWQGFVREDRQDGVWRRERCEGDDDGKSDKAGETDGRAAQCG